MLVYHITRPEPIRVRGRGGQKLLKITGKGRGMQWKIFVSWRRDMSSLFFHDMSARAFISSSVRPGMCLARQSEKRKLYPPQLLP